MTGKPGDALSFIPGLAQARPHSHSEDELIVTALIPGIKRITIIGTHLERDALDEAVGQHQTNAMEAMNTQAESI